MAGFLPPAIIEIKAVADEAIAKFKAVNNELEKMEGQAQKAGGSVDNMQKASRVATAALIGMGTAFAGFAAIGLKEAEQTEQAFNKLGVTLSNLGINTEKNRKQIENLASSYIKLGFADDIAATAFNKLLIATGDVNKSQEMLALSADLARVKNIGLTDAASILAKASQGSARAFKEMGISIDTTIPKSEGIAKAFDQLEQKIGGQAVAYTKTFKGQLAVLKETFLDNAETIGQALLPYLTRLVQAFASGIDFVKRNAQAFKLFGGIIVGLTIAIASYNATVKTITFVTNVWSKATAFAKGVLALFTKQQHAANAAMKANPIGLIVSAVMLLIGAFIMLWNRSEPFRKLVIQIGKAGLAAFSAIIPIIGRVFEAIAKIVTGPLRALLTALSKLPGVGKYAKAGLDIINKGLDGISNMADGAAKKAAELAGNLDKLNKPIKIGGGNKLEIPKFKNGEVVIPGASPDDKKAQAKIKKNNEGYMKTVKALNEKVLDARKTFNEAMAKAQKDYQEADTKATLKYNEDLLKLENKKAEDTLKVQNEEKKKIAEAQKNFNDFMAKLNAKKLEDTAKAEKENKDKIAAIYRENAIKLQEIVQQSIDRLRDAYKKGTEFSVTDLFKGLKEAGTASANGLLDALKGKLADAKKLAAKASELAAAGFSQTFIEQVVSAGPEVGTELADSILKATPETIKELQSTFKAMESQSENGLDTLATTMNQGARLATAELNKAYAEAQGELSIFLAEQARNYAASQAEITKEFNAQMAEAEKTRDEAIATAKSDAIAALDAIDKEFMERSAELHKDLIDTLQENAKALAEAQEEARKKLSETLDDIAKEYKEKLGKVKDAVASTMTAIAGLKMAMAEAQTLTVVKATATTASTGVTTGAFAERNAILGQTPTNAQTVNNTNVNIATTNMTSPKQVADDVLYGIKYGQTVKVTSAPKPTGAWAERFK